jgi:hypothetical protein
MDMSNAIRWRVEALAALHEVNTALLMALCRQIPNRPQLLADFDQHVEVARVQMLGSDNSDLAIAALDDYSAWLRQSMQGLPADE